MIPNSPYTSLPKILAMIMADNNDSPFPITFPKIAQKESFTSLLLIRRTFNS